MIHFCDSAPPSSSPLEFFMRQYLSRGLLIVSVALVSVACSGSTATATPNATAPPTASAPPTAPATPTGHPDGHRCSDGHGFSDRGFRGPGRRRLSRNRPTEALHPQRYLEHLPPPKASSRG